MIHVERIAAAIIGPETSLLDAVKAIEAGGIQAALIAMPDGSLKGVVTDGDIRRGILRGMTLDSAVSQVMNSTPTVLRQPSSREEASAVMANLHIRQIPVLDGMGRIAGAYHIDSLDDPETPKDDTWVVIMAGGRGTRLHPLTQTMPKPMIPVGGQPLIETIVRTLVSQGFRRIYLSVNYMADVFKAHFGNGSRFGAEIRYIDEAKQLGTAGALGMLNEIPPGPLLVMNGDLLTAVNFNNLVQFHREHGAAATLCVREYQIQIPYGVIEIEGSRVNAIAEKPTKTFFVSAGIYVLDPSVMKRIAPGHYLDMPQLIESVIADGESVSSFPIHEYWLDIGKFDDLERAQAEFHRVFGG